MKIGSWSLSAGLPRVARGLGVAPLLALLALAGCAPTPEVDAAHQRGYRGVVLDSPVSKPDFTLTDTEGRPYDFRLETEGRLALLFVGYTNCPDVCPVHMANLAAVLRQMPELNDRLTVIFVTADPERDTPERLREWLDVFNPRFVGLRGTREEVNRIEDELSVAHSAVPMSPSGNYPVGHASQVFAFSPHGEAHVVYPFGTRQVDLATDLPRLVTDTWEDR